MLAIEIILLQLLVIYLTRKEFATDPLEDLYRPLEKEYLALKPRQISNAAMGRKTAPTNASDLPTA